eukprot:5800383-Prymnesium_polylepis.1
MTFECASCVTLCGGVLRALRSACAGEAKVTCAHLIAVVVIELLQQSMQQDNRLAHQVDIPCLQLWLCAQKMLQVLVVSLAQQLHHLENIDREGARMIWLLDLLLEHRNALFRLHVIALHVGVEIIEPKLLVRE